MDSLLENLYMKKKRSEFPSFQFDSCGNIIANDNITNFSDLYSKGLNSLKTITSSSLRSYNAQKSSASSDSICDVIGCKTYCIEVFDDEKVATEYTCGICYEIGNKMYEIGTCGHLFCGNCIKEYHIREIIKNKDLSKIQCPGCRTAYKGKVSISNFVNRSIGKLNVKCPIDKCEWRGTFCELCRHKHPSANNYITKNLYSTISSYVSRYRSI